MPEHFEQTNGHGVARHGGLGTAELRDISREVSEISAQIGELASLEMRMAKAELSEAASAAAVGAAWGYGALVMVWLTVGSLLAALAFALTNWVDPWVAALITAGVAAVIAGIAAAVCINTFKSISFTPKRTMASIQEDLRWLRNPLRSNSK